MRLALVLPDQLGDQVPGSVGIVGGSDVSFFAQLGGPASDPFVGAGLGHAAHVLTSSPAMRRSSLTTGPRSSRRPSQAALLSRRS